MNRFGLPSPEPAHRPDRSSRPRRGAPPADIPRSRSPHKRPRPGHGGTATPNYTLIGAASLIVLILITWAVFEKRVPFVHRYRISAIFSSANQLRPGSPVRIAGVDVGSVIGISRGPGATARVRMTIGDQGRPIHTDARMQIRPRLFLEGGYYVELQPGTPQTAQLRDGGTVPLAHTAIPVQVDQVLSMLDSPTRSSLKDVLTELSRGLSHGGATGLNQALPELPPTLRDGSVALQALQGTSAGDPHRLITSTAAVMNTLASRDTQLGDLIGSLRRTSDALAARDSALAATVRGIDDTLRAAPPALSALDSALPRLRSFTAAVRPALPDAPATLTQARALLRQIAALTAPAELPRLQDLLDPALGDLPTLERRLDTLLPLVTPVVSCVRDRAVPVLTSKLDDGALSTNRPVWQDLAHTMVGLASADQSFDGDGSWIRFLAVSGPSAINTGPVSAEGTLFGSDASPVVGTRPQWLGQGRTPPLRPDQPCTSQPAPDLHAAAAPAPSAAPASAVRLDHPAPGALAALRRSAATATAHALRNGTR